MLLVAEQDPPQGDVGAGDETYRAYSPPVSQPAPETPARPETPEVPPPTHVPYGAKQNYSGSYPSALGGTDLSGLDPALLKSSRSCGVVLPIVLLAVFLPLVFGAIGLVKGITGSFDDLTDGGNPFTRDKVDMHSVAGFEGLLEALRSNNGGTTVEEVVVYPEYAVVYVPADETSKRYYSMYYDGELSQTSQGTTDYTRFDLSTIDPEILVRLLEKAGTELVEDAIMTYAIIREPRQYDQDAWFSVYASNDFGESGYFTADKRGKIITTHLSQ